MYLFTIQILTLFISGIYIIYKDLKERIIPNKVVLILIIMGIFITALDYNNLFSHVVGFFVTGLLLLLIAGITKAFGMGDVKYMFAVGLIIGFVPGLNAVMISFVIGGIVSAILLILKKVKKTDYIAFGPYLVIGSIISLIYSII